MKNLLFSLVFLVVMFGLTGHFMGVDILGKIFALLGALV